MSQANKELEKLDKEHADLEKLEDAIQADTDRLSSSGGVAPSQLSWQLLQDMYQVVISGGVRRDYKFSWCY